VLSKKPLQVGVCLTRNISDLKYFETLIKAMKTYQAKLTEFHEILDRINKQYDDDYEGMI
jgi:hypothetical protein